MEVIIKISFDIKYYTKIEREISMFSSEQILEVSGEMGQLEMALNFALNMSGYHKTISYQITNDGKYCLGWYCDESLGWKQFQFDFDVHIVSEIIKQHLNKLEIDNPYEYADGSSVKGFLMKAIDNSFADEELGVKEPFYGIISIEPYYNYYAK